MYKIEDYLCKPDSSSSFFFHKKKRMGAMFRCSLQFFNTSMTLSTIQLLKGIYTNIQVTHIHYFVGKCYIQNNYNVLYTFYLCVLLL